jgi:hypothetical protein
MLHTTVYSLIHNTLTIIFKCATNATWVSNTSISVGRCRILCTRMINVTYATSTTGRTTPCTFWSTRTTCISAVCFCKFFDISSTYSLIS